MTAAREERRLVVATGAGSVASREAVVGEKLESPDQRCAVIVRAAPGGAGVHEFLRRRRVGQCHAGRSRAR